MIVGLGRRRYRKCLPNLGIKPGGGGRRHAQAGRKPHREMLDPFQCPHPLSYLEACSAKSPYAPEKVQRSQNTFT